jgi:type I restriction enzyme S subunit
VYHVCSVTPWFDPQYIALLLRALGKSGYLEASAWSVRQRSVDFRNWSTFSRLEVELPAFEVQRDVAEELADDAALTMEAITTAHRSIELAKERRAALISAAVTGKIDIGGAA